MLRGSEYYGAKYVWVLNILGSYIKNVHGIYFIKYVNYFPKMLRGPEYYGAKYVWVLNMLGS